MLSIPDGRDSRSKSACPAAPYRYGSVGAGPSACPPFTCSLMQITISTLIYRHNRSTKSLLLQRKLSSMLCTRSPPSQTGSYQGRCFLADTPMWSLADAGGVWSFCVSQFTSSILEVPEIGSHISDPDLLLVGCMTKERRSYSRSCSRAA